MDGNGNELSGVGCCFCNKNIKINKTDPCDITVIGNCGRPEEEQQDQFFWCHLECFQKRAKAKHIYSIIISIKELLKRIILKSYDSENNNIFPGALCLYCNKKIIISKIDPSTITIRTNWCDTYGRKTTQAFWCHLECLRANMHP